MECIQHWARLWGKGCRRILVGPCCPENCNVSGRSGKPRKMVLENGGLTDVYVKKGAHGEGGWRRNSAWRSGAGPQLSVAPTHTPLWSAEHMGHPRNPFCCPFLLEVCHLPLEIFFFLKWRDRIPFLPWYLPWWKFEEVITFYNYIILLFGLVMWESPPTRPQSCHLSVHPSIHSPSHLCSESYGAFMICEAL